MPKQEPFDNTNEGLITVLLVNPITGIKVYVTLLHRHPDTKKIFAFDYHPEFYQACAMTVDQLNELQQFCRSGKLSNFVFIASPMTNDVLTPAQKKLLNLA